MERAREQEGLRSSTRINVNDMEHQAAEAWGCTLVFQLVNPVLPSSVIDISPNEISLPNYILLLGAPKSYCTVSEGFYWGCSVDNFDRRHIMISQTVFVLNPHAFLFYLRYISNHSYSLLYVRVLPTKTTTVSNWAPLAAARVPKFSVASSWALTI